jgi:hypothetical protein
MPNITRDDSIRITSSECQSCSQKGLAKFVIEDEKTRVCGTCFQELGPRNDVPIPLACINKLVKRLGRSSGFALVEFNPDMDVRPSHVYGVDSYGVLKSLSLIMQHRSRPDVKVKLEWFTFKQEDKPADKSKSESRHSEPDRRSFREREEAERLERRAALDDKKLRVHADDTICEIVESILKGLRGDEYDAVHVTQTSFQPFPQRSFVRFELTFWYDMNLPRTLQTMRGELSWDSLPENRS